MPGMRVRRLLLIGGVGALAAAAVRALRGDPAPQFANHPSVDGGPRAAKPPVDVNEPSVPASNGRTQPQLPLADAPADPPAPIRAAVGEPGPGEADAWVFPVDDVGCPDGYPVKAKLKSGLFHLPGMAAYERTKPDRCYPSAEAAEADGLRAAKR